MGHGDEVFLKDALVFLFAAGIIVPFFRALKIPSVAGFLLAGILLGPQGLGRFDDNWPTLAFFTVAEPEAAAPFAELGVLFLLFLLGLEMSFEKLWALRKTVFGAGAFQALTSALVIAGTLILFGMEAPAAAAIGLALALSSTAIVMQLLSEEKRAAGPVGRASLSVLLFQDILVAPILIFVGFLSRDTSGGLAAIIGESLIQGIGAVVVIVLIGRLLLARVFRMAARAGGRDFLMAVTLFVVIGAAVLTASAGLSLALGAFMAGLLLGETEFKHQTEVDLEPFKGLLLGLFFMTVGMSLDLASISEILPLVLGGLAALLVAKTLIAFVACKLFAGPSRMSIETAFLLAPAGEFAFVVMTAAISEDVISADIITPVTAIAGLSMLLIPVMSRLGRLWAKRLRVPDPSELTTGDFSSQEGHVIIAGFGRVGRAIFHILESENTEIIALDRTIERARLGQKEGAHVYLGDAAREEILIRAGGRGAAMFIITVDDAASAEAMVRAARKLRPNGTILARARDADHGRALHRAGASYVIPDAIEAGLQLAGRALEEFGLPGESVRDRIAAEREAEYRLASDQGS